MTVGGVAREIYEHLGGILKGLGEDKKELEVEEGIKAEGGRMRGRIQEVREKRMLV